MLWATGAYSGIMHENIGTAHTDSVHRHIVTSNQSVAAPHLALAHTTLFFAMRLN